ncbi:MAG: hypothetical protein WAK18_12585, partial [Nocardioidaceae bacterium]
MNKHESCRLKFYRTIERTPKVESVSLRFLSGTTPDLAISSQQLAVFSPASPAERLSVRDDAGQQGPQVGIGALPEPLGDAGLD